MCDCAKLWISKIFEKISFVPSIGMLTHILYFWFYINSGF